MTRKEFAVKHDEIFGEEVGDADVLMRIASNISDLEVDSSNLKSKAFYLKEYIFDYISVVRSERKSK